MNDLPTRTPPNRKRIQPILARYQRPDTKKALWQLANTLIPYALLWVLAYLSLNVSYLLTLPLTVLAAGFLVRAFIIFHDCGHGSFLPSRQANDIVGIITGLLTFTPYYRWRHDHAIHHATSGDLDRRGVGDVPTLTVEEFQALPPFQRFIYRFWRHPLILLTIGPLVMFVIIQRFPAKGGGRREQISVHATNLALAGMIAGLIALMGWQAYLLIQLPIIAIAAAAGVWLFYVQHNYEGTYWERHEKWDYMTAALYGSSFYQLPTVLQWFSGNIGFHHIHHLSPRIPNYLLAKCHRENPIFHVEPLTLRKSLRSLRLRLWSEEAGRMVGFEVLQPAQAK